MKIKTFPLILLIATSFLYGSIIKVGDVLEISVPGSEEFSGQYVVMDDGTIDYPLLVDQPIINISTLELMNELTIRLAKYVDNPLVSIQIVENPDIRVTVLGQIGSPGPLATYQGVSLQEVIVQAGGPTKYADLKKIKIVRKDGSDNEAIFFNLEEFLDKGNVSELPRILNEDRILLLTKERSTKVKVIGAVRKPGFFELQEDVNLFEIVYLAGGPSEKADLSRVRRLFKHDGKTMEEVVDLKGYIDKGAMDDIPMVAESDVIIVYAKWFDWRTLLTILNNTLLFIVTVQTFSGVFNK
ncbi:MAG: hypothetical protein GF401_07275 [Chitinivibrionales bacterium]|nr:hypothetical protein [Chitinivibrionales bacterium]